MPTFRVTFEGRSDRKLNWQELIKALKFIIEENQRHNDFLSEPVKVKDFIIDYIRVSNNDLIWENELYPNQESLIRIPPTLPLPLFDGDIEWLMSEEDK